MSKQTKRDRWLEVFGRACYCRSRTKKEPALQEDALWLSRRQFIKVSSIEVLLAICSFPFLQGCTPPDTTLAQLINNYRQQNRLPAIPISSKLMQVASTHISDLRAYRPENNCAANFHSWSTHGTWTGGCYKADDNSTWSIMWDKPKEIAGYPDKGYEIAYAGSSAAQDALNSWKSSSPHNDVMLNKGQWQPFQWKALGAAYGGGYACAWFGATSD